MKGRHYLPPRGLPPLWRLTVTSKDGRELISHATGEDEKEIQALATEARGRNLGHKIRIKPPIGALYSWD